MRPQRFYGLHFAEGVAEYQEPTGSSYRILINEETIKNMDPSFDGLPVFVHHVDEVDLSDNEQLKKDADGYVIRSFFNKADGKHWAEFLVVSERGLDAIINKKWKLSNAYVPQSMGSGGVWHGVDYDREVKSGAYEHLAIVPNPRYAESIILTPEEFKQYNMDKEADLSRLTNSKKGEGMLNFFKKQKAENSADLESMSVILPKSKKEITLAKLVNDMDDMEMNAEEPKMADGEHQVMVGENKMTVNDLVKKHMDMCNEMEEMKKKNAPEAEDEEAKKKALEMKANEDEEMKEKKANEDKEAEEKKQNDFIALKNAREAALKNKQAPTVELSEDRVKRGQKRYGSN